MPVIRFTELSLGNLKAEKTTRFFDSGLANFGISVGKRRKTFFVMTGDDRQLTTLGHFPSISLKSARREALAIIDGTKPLQEAQDPAARLTAYIAQLRGSKRYVYDQERLLRKYLLPKTSDLTEVSKRDILAITDALADTPSEQLHTHRAIRAFFNWLLARDHIAASPLTGLNAPSSENFRARILTPQELKFAWSVGEIPAPFRRVIRACMLLGTRQGETTATQPPWLSDAGLTIPPQATKNGREHLLPLTPAARHHVAELAANEKPNWNSWNKHKKKAKWSDTTIHDIRRTFATLHAQIGTPPHIIERLLNHATGQISGVAAIYNRYQYQAEMLQALTAYGRHLEAIIGEPLI